MMRRLTPARLAAAASGFCAALLPVLGVTWIAGVPQWLGTTWLDGQILPLVIGLATAAALLRHPYGKQPGWPELLLAVAALSSWSWSALNYDAWIVEFAETRPDQWLPGSIALLSLLEALRKSCGMAVTLLVWVFLLLAGLGTLAGGAVAAALQSPPELVLYLYADSQGVPGFIVRVVVTLVLAFVLLGRLMEASGATGFFTALAMRLMAHRRGGAAKVSVVASGAFGMVSGSTVGNVMSTGLVTIPLMKRDGLPPPLAGAVEAVASNGGQLAPPVMGATAFLIAEFLQISYREVVLAALVPAALYFLVLLVQIDAIAARLGLAGQADREGPTLSELCRRNWGLVLPLGALLILLFVLEMNAGRAALLAAALLLGLAARRDRTVLQPARLAALCAETGSNLLPILLIGAGAGIVVGVLNGSGLGFQLSIALAAIGANAGLFAMLLLAAMLAVVLGMGMPTAAVYLVLSVVLAPALVAYGVEPLAAHLFLFYFGVLSMLTPPVAVAAFVAAGLAGAGFWQTSWHAMRLALLAYVIPFVWIYNPALILRGSPAENLGCLLLAAAAGLLLARGLNPLPGRGWLAAVQVVAAAALGILIVRLG